MRVRPGRAILRNSDSSRLKAHRYVADVASNGSSASLETGTGSSNPLSSATESLGEFSLVHERLGYLAVPGHSDTLITLQRVNEQRLRLFEIARSGAVD